MRIWGVLFVFALMFSWSSCDIINPAERAPTYIHIDSFKFIPTLNTGTSSHKITSVTVEVDNFSIGTYDLPATIPILADQKTVIRFKPGINFSGLSDVQAVYNFYEPDTLTILPQVGQVINYNPKTKYWPDSTLKILNIDFETGSAFDTITGDTIMVKTSDPNYLFEGSYSGLIYLNNQKKSEIIFSNSFTGPVETFVELDYKSSLPFTIGLQATNSSGNLFVNYLYGFRPRDNWNKIYVGLQDFISAYPNQSYRIVIKVQSDTPTHGYVALDNIKVISFK
jgi:hypothetical protein